MGKQTKYEFENGSFVIGGQLFTFFKHATVRKTVWNLKEQVKRES